MFRPWCQICGMILYREVKVASQFLENIPQGGGRFHPGRDGESEPVRLSRSVVGVLSQDDHTCLSGGCLFKGMEDLPLWGVDGGGLPELGDPREQLPGLLPHLG